MIRFEVVINPRCGYVGGGDPHQLYVRGDNGNTVFDFDTLRKIQGLPITDWFHALDEDQIWDQMSMNFSDFEIEQTIKWMKAYSPEWL